MNSGPEDVSAAVIEKTISAWYDYFTATLSPPLSVADVDRLMAPVSWDRAWIHHGGSGRRSRAYAIDAYLQARFDFDRDGTLVSYAIFAAPRRWLKGPDGVLQHGFDDGTAELQFIEVPPSNR